MGDPNGVEVKRGESVVAYVGPSPHEQDVVDVDVWYPRVSGTRWLELGLIDVRAADSIRVGYDFERDGWSVQQASRFIWRDDEESDPGWQEVAFAKAWARENDPPALNKAIGWEKDEDDVINSAGNQIDDQRREWRREVGYFLLSVIPCPGSTQWNYGISHIRRCSGCSGYAASRDEAIAAVKAAARRAGIRI